MPNWVGDVVMATPLLAALRRRFPEARIEAALSPHLAPLLSGFEGLDGLRPIARGKGLPAILRAASVLRAGRFDLALLLANSFRSAAEAFLARIPQRRGYAGDGRRLLLTESAPRHRGADGRIRPLPMVDYYLDLAAGLGIETRDRRYRLPLLEVDEALVDAWLAEQGHEAGTALFGLNPGASFGASKLWRPDRFAAVGDQLQERLGARAVLIGGPGERDLLREVAAAMRLPPLGGPDRILALGPLRALIARFRLLVTTDTGPRAMAQAFGVPHVVLMGPTHPGWTDANNEKARILRHEVPCGPCHKKVCDLDHACMERIAVAEVLGAAEALLAGLESRDPKARPTPPPASDKV